MNQDLKTLVSKVGDLPPMPVVAVKVMELMQDPDTGAEDLAKTIANDQAVSARVLKIANSSFYSLQRQVKTLEHAIVILGEKTLRSLVLASSLQSINKKFGLMEKMLWEDSMGCAIGARLTCLWFKTGDPEESFLAGLFRHIGRMVMNNIDSAKFQTMVADAYAEGVPLREIELQYFPFSHAQLGAAVLQKWNFSESLIHIVANHEDLHALSDDPVLQRLAANVNISEGLCRRLGVGQRFPDNDLDLASRPGAAVLGVDADQLDQLLEEFKSFFEKDRESFMGG